MREFPSYIEMSDSLRTWIGETFELCEPLGVRLRGIVDWNVPRVGCFAEYVDSSQPIHAGSGAYREEGKLYGYVLRRLRELRSPVLCYGWEIRESDEWISSCGRSDTRFFFVYVNSHVFLLPSALQNEECVDAAFRYASAPVHELALVTSGLGDFFHPDMSLSAPDVDLLVSRTVELIIGCYDGESWFVLPTRNHYPEPI
ncbi:MAG: hypothetical protein IJR99_10475 [Kiritimatiellae bacterium]|nr:hypothetical protein [Kiritimatiellia bacterium]